MTKTMTVRQLVLLALFTALVAGATALQIPNGFGGNMNAGDILVITSAACLGYYAVIPAALGSALIDLLSPYSLYAPATLIIKGLMALVFVFILRKFNVHNIRNMENMKENEKKHSFLAIIVSATIAEIIMVAGYFAYEAFIIGWQPAVLGVPFNLIQGAFGVVGGSLLARVFLTKNILRRFQ